MCEDTFLDLIREIREASLDTLVKKNSGYATEDRLHNFREGAKVSGLTTAQTAWGYLTKHLVALRDKIEKNDFSDRNDFKEKVQDSINYLCIIWAIGNDEGSDRHSCGFCGGKDGVSVFDERGNRLIAGFCPVCGNQFL